MSRTASAGVKINNNGTSLTGAAFLTLDLTGILSATDEGNGIANVAGSGGAAGTNIATEVITASQSGTSITLDLTTLAHTFVAIEVVFRNGQNITPVSSWSRVSNTITVFNADAGEVFQVQYTY